MQYAVCRCIFRSMHCSMQCAVYYILGIKSVVYNAVTKSSLIVQSGVARQDVGLMGVKLMAGWVSAGARACSFDSTRDPPQMGASYPLPGWEPATWMGAIPPDGSLIPSSILAIVPGSLPLSSYKTSISEKFLPREKRENLKPYFEVIELRGDC